MLHIKYILILRVLIIKIYFFLKLYTNCKQIIENFLHVNADHFRNETKQC